MSERKDSLILYESFFEATEGLRASAKAEIWDALGKHLKGEAHVFKDKIAEQAWKFILLQLKADKKKWDARCEKNRSNGALGGRPKKDVENPEKPNGYSKNRTVIKKPDTDTESDTDISSNEDIDDIVRSRKKTVEEIYQAYPRKVAKPNALKAILKALEKKRPEKTFTPMPAEELLAKTRAYAAAVGEWSDEEKKFIPHPATWFNQERYNDDPSTWVKKGKSDGQKRGTSADDHARGF